MIQACLEVVYQMNLCANSHKTLTSQMMIKVNLQLGKLSLWAKAIIHPGIQALNTKRQPQEQKSNLK